MYEIISRQSLSGQSEPFSLVGGPLSCGMILPSTSSSMAAKALLARGCSRRKRPRVSLQQSMRHSRISRTRRFISMTKVRAPFPLRFGNTVTFFFSLLLLGKPLAKVEQSSRTEIKSVVDRDDDGNSSKAVGRSSSNHTVQTPRSATLEGEGASLMRVRNKLHACFSSLRTPSKSLASLELILNEYFPRMALQIKLRNFPHVFSTLLPTQQSMPDDKGCPPGAEYGATYRISCTLTAASAIVSVLTLDMGPRVLIRERAFDGDMMEPGSFDREAALMLGSIVWAIHIRSTSLPSALNTNSSRKTMNRRVTVVHDAFDRIAGKPSSFAADDSLDASPPPSISIGSCTEDSTAVSPKLDAILITISLTSTAVDGGDEVLVAPSESQETICARRERTDAFSALP
mmetsp:Transcript_13769/g.30603  ORF Transcript_13769/g.30603 Transcript_13769/m.30603 type:complete len:401 (-) Transcript_13769:897-2099(-)